MSDEERLHFYLKNGEAIKTLAELSTLLGSMPDELFTHHVNEDRNDFAIWIKDVLKKESLAKDIWETRNKKEMLDMLDAYLQSHLPFHRKLKTVWKNYSRKSKKKTKQQTESPAQKPRRNIQRESFKLATPSYLKLGVPGFDDLITKGLPVGSSVLLCGGPGSGKTTFALQLLAGIAQQGKKGLYLSFEEPPERLYYHMDSYGWDPARLVKSNLLRIRKLNPFDLSRSVEALLAKASGELLIELDELEGIIPPDFTPDVVVVDSLSAVGSAFVGKEQGYRAYIEQIFNLFEQRGFTSFLISEIEQNASRYSRTGVEEFLADGVITFYNIRQKSVRVSAIEIIKIRGVQHMKKIVPFKMLPGTGITVYPQEEVFFTAD